MPHFTLVFTCMLLYTVFLGTLFYQSVVVLMSDQEGDGSPASKVHGCCSRENEIVYLEVWRGVERSNDNIHGITTRCQRNGRVDYRLVFSCFWCFDMTHVMHNMFAGICTC